MIGERRHEGWLGRSVTVGDRTVGLAKVGVAKEAS